MYNVHIIDVRSIVAGGGIEFDWDKANVNHLARHNVHPEEAEQAICNGSVEINYQVVDGEEQYAVVGRTNRARFLTLVLADREGAIRVITAWDSTAEEETEYWKEFK